MRWQFSRLQSRSQIYSGSRWLLDKLPCVARNLIIQALYSDIWRRAVLPPPDFSSTYITKAEYTSKALISQLTQRKQYSISHLLFQLLFSTNTRLFNLKDKILKYHQMVLQIVIALWDWTMPMVSQTFCIRRGIST